MWSLRDQQQDTRVGRQLETKRLFVRSGIMHRLGQTRAWPQDSCVQSAIIIAVLPSSGSPVPSLATDLELNDFLRNVDRRAFKRTSYLVRDDDAALDIVQDSMIRLAEKYADRPAAELPMLFQRILSNATMDWFRRKKVRNAVMQNMSDFESGSGDDDFDLLEMLESQEGALGSLSAADEVSRAQILQAIEAEVAELPARQREAFLLRYWEELDVAETAVVMGCSEGSVKTHCSRAVHSLAKSLKAKGITL